MLTIIGRPSIVMDNPLAFITPCATIVAGGSSTGKTVLVSHILNNLDYCYDKPTRKIMYFYTVYQPIFLQLEQELENIEFFKGLPTEEHLEAVEDANFHDIIIMDDLLAECSSSQFVENLFVRNSHHNNISLILITQCLYYAGKNRKTQANNAQYFIFLKNKAALATINTFARQRFPLRSRQFMEIYQDATKKPFSFLIADFHAKSDDKYALRAGMLPGDDKIIYKMS